jgi:hypothetical protein
LATNTADGRLLAAAVPPCAPAHRGTRTTRVPLPCGSWTLVVPVVLSSAATFADATVTPVPQGGTITVRAASAVGTITALVP